MIIDAEKFYDIAGGWDRWNPAAFDTQLINVISSINSKDYIKKENKNNMNTNFLNNMFGRVADGMCRMSINGDMAIKTSSGYKTYDVKSGTLTNCNNFVFDVGSEFFFIIPTNKVETGDVILAAGKPHCVIKVEPNRIEALRYEDGSIITIVPERIVFCGQVYFYGKIVSMFGNIKSKNGVNSMMKYMMMSEMMKSKDNSGNGMNSILPMMMFLQNGSMGNIFNEMFNSGNNENDNEEEEEK